MTTTRRKTKATGPTTGDRFEQVTGRHRGRVIEIDTALGLTASARAHIARTSGTPHAERVRRRRNYFLATTLRPAHLAGRVFRVSEKTLAIKYKVDDATAKA